MVKTKKEEMDEKPKEEKVKLKEPYGGKETPEEEAEEAKKGVDEDEKLEKETCPKCKGKMVDGTCDECGYTAKGEMGGENPEEDTSASTNAEHSTSPNMGVPSTQNVYVPTSNIKVSRDQPKHPNEVMLGRETSSNVPANQSYGKSVDMNKSPLFVEITKQINNMQLALTKKLESTEKSFNDRVGNMQKALDKFYGQSFYKAIDENNGAETIQKESIKEQIAKGKIEFR